MTHEIYLNKEKTIKATYEVNSFGHAILKEDITYYVFGKSTVWAYGNSEVRACDDSEVTVFDNAKVIYNRKIRKNEYN